MNSELPGENIANLSRQYDTAYEPLKDRLLVYDVVAIFHQHAHAHGVARTS
jgi:hypothetical protein